MFSVEIIINFFCSITVFQVVGPPLGAFVVFSGTWCSCQSLPVSLRILDKCSLAPLSSRRNMSFSYVVVCALWCSVREYAFIGSAKLVLRKTFGCFYVTRYLLDYGNRKKIHFNIYTFM